MTSLGLGGQCAHDAGVKNVAGGNAVIAQPLLHGIIQNACKNLLQIFGLGLFRGRVIIQTQQIQQPVGQDLVIHRLSQAAIHGIGYKGINVGFDLHIRTLQV